MLLAAGCATGTIRQPSGLTFSGSAIGHAEVEVCELVPPPPTPPMSAAAQSCDCPTQVCSHVKGGALSETFAEFLTTAVTALFGWLAL